jgi:hypothetical protein
LIELKDAKNINNLSLQISARNYPIIQKRNYLNFVLGQNNFVAWGKYPPHQIIGP